MEIGSVGSSSYVVVCEVNTTLLVDDKECAVVLM